MRTTLTLEPDVTAKLKEAMRERELSFKETVNLYLRRGLNAKKPRPGTRFKVRARDLGAQPGVGFDDIAGLLDEIDGPAGR